MLMNTDAGVRVVANLPYRDGANLDAYARECCVLDLYLPPARQAGPMLVWFHGGALTMGSKDAPDDVMLARFFAARGLAVAVPNYRLAPHVAFPTFIDDAMAAVTYTATRLDAYTPQGLFITGHSAGGYLAAFAGLWLRDLPIAGLIPISGQTFTHTTIREARGIATPCATPLLDDAAPCYHVRPDAPPVLALCGDHDMPMRAEENRFFVAMLTTVGHPAATYLEIADRDHATIATRIPEPNDPAATAILDFVARHA
jgi:acetyl esterase/lipase